MSGHFGYLDQYIKIHIEQLLREAADERLAALAVGPGRPWRARLADLLYSAAERIEGHSAAQDSIARAQM